MGFKGELTAITYTEENGIGVITLNRPESRNALSLGMREELGQVVSYLRQELPVYALVLTATGGHFCAGGDLKALTDAPTPPAGARKKIEDIHVWFRDLVDLELPVIAAVDGSAYGGGLCLALTADFILCSERARFCTVFGRIGMVPDLGGFFLLPRVVGLQKAKDLVFTSRSVGADEALQIGLACEIHPHEVLLEKAMQFASRFRHASTDAIGLSKRVLNQSSHLDNVAITQLEGLAQAVCLESDYHQTAVARFLDKEPLLFNWDQILADENK